MMNLVLVSYVAIVAMLVWILHRWERMLRVPGFGSPE
jgi:polar amino acid transport system permease protein